MIALNFLYLISNLPYMVNVIYYNILTFRGNFTSRTYLITSLLLSFTTGLASCNFVFPLVVNLIFFKTFRREFFYYFTRFRPIDGSVRPTNTGQSIRRNGLHTITTGGISMITMNRSLN